MVRQSLMSPRYIDGQISVKFCLASLTRSLRTQVIETGCSFQLESQLAVGDGTATLFHTLHRLVNRGIDSRLKFAASITPQTHVMVAFAPGPGRLKNQVARLPNAVTTRSVTELPNDAPAGMKAERLRLAAKYEAALDTRQQPSPFSIAQRAHASLECSRFVRVRRSQNATSLFLKTLEIASEFLYSRSECLLHYKHSTGLYWWVFTGKLTAGAARPAVSLCAYGFRLEHAAVC